MLAFLQWRDGERWAGGGGGAGTLIFSVMTRDVTV